MGNNTTECPENQFSHTLHLIAYSVLFLVGLVLNAIALFIFVRYLKLHSVVSIYMFNLALSDLLFTISLPLRIYYYSMGKWEMTNALCQLSGSLFQMNMYGSCLFLMCISVDRFVAIVFPLRFRHLRRPHVARLVCLSMWALIIGSSVPVFLAHDVSECLENGNLIYRCFETFSKNDWKELLPLVAMAVILGFLVPLVAVSSCTVRILYELCRTQSPQGIRRRKTVFLLVVNLGIFLICFVPYNTALALYTMVKTGLLQSNSLTKDALRPVVTVTIVLASLNCCLDPLVYYFSTEGFRNTFKKLGSTMTSSVPRETPVTEKEGHFLQSLVATSKESKSNSSRTLDLANKALENDLQTTDNLLQGS
ncbi:lysophosphatidic acid receptor 5 [Latimeria chalumnae]|uniref:Lysophosphatidic acid receptor 5 n=1 Tax=Latimeria chalumnae TaxID=7897 RepID=H3A548_LATCH|nr:PREDICTED: lysophosphatidic acid receptor 5 [Latimeria chalumnae]XP_014350366.1 PREDICTED: lysophosphatidic acid receptor 5 [Latimeria chalumnae]XP_014350367.1 PREDICTED: lysophosphatidic acid receptor 5 [Latimeria chalumnae]XP_014350368.1 PREDICTED: lysophosphatidic acid receptor 5 [Latimeria chalumnae]|eukprot:XP_006006536.1 PREDICTED: lysophosphatidic acid receptor 5 [Latimeria chalumnae]